MFLLEEILKFHLMIIQPVSRREPKVKLEVGSRNRGTSKEPVFAIVFFPSPHFIFPENFFTCEKQFCNAAGFPVYMEGRCVCVCVCGGKLRGPSSLALRCSQKALCPPSFAVRQPRIPHNWSFWRTSRSSGGAGFTRAASWPGFCQRYVVPSNRSVHSYKSMASLLSQKTYHHLFPLCKSNRILLAPRNITVT